MAQSIPDSIIRDDISMEMTFIDRRAKQSTYSDVQVEMTRMVFDGVAPTVASGGVALVAATALMAVRYSDSFLWGISIAAFVLVCARLLLIRAFKAVPEAVLTAEKAYRMELTFGLSTVFYAAVIAAIPLRVFGSHETDAETWCAMGIFAFASGISGRVAMRPWIAQGAGAIMLLTLSYVLLRSEVLLVQCSTSSVLAYLFFHCESVRSKFRTAVDQVRTKRRLAHLAQHDALTGLANRRQFEAAMAQACREDAPFAILYIDLDRFKAINDTFGHAAGDALLKSVAERLRQAVRSSDALARLGGDEFAILQSPDATQATAEALAARITEIVARPYTIGADTMIVGVSVGICLRGAAVCDTESAMKLADKALYAVKQAGGGSFSTAS